MAQVLGVEHSRPAFDLPLGACDCHVHVFGPADRYPLSATRRYTPEPALVSDLLRLHAFLGIERVVVVGASPYGTDNSCLLDALAELGSRARGVAVIDEGTPDEELIRLDRAGVRGARVNVETEGERDTRKVVRMLVSTAERVGPLGWHVEVYANLCMLSALHDVLAGLGIRVVVDHFGLPRAEKGLEQPGFRELLALVESGKAYVKLSAPYRISSSPNYADVRPIARALVEANPERVLWGSDWPHPIARLMAAGSPGGPFRAEDDGRALNFLMTWTRSEQELRKVLVDNAAHLYGF